jgi:hypothetical protein
MAAGTNDKTAAPTRPVQLPHPRQADQARGDMVSENRAANERFQRNSKVLQQEQAARTEARTGGAGQQEIAASQPQAAKPELSFAPDRQQGQTQGPPKQEQANPVAKDQAPQPGAKKELSFGTDRQPHRPNYNLLKVEQAKAVGNAQGQQQGDKKGLTFGPGREDGQGKGQDHGHGR